MKLMPSTLSTALALTLAAALAAPGPALAQSGSRDAGTPGSPGTSGTVNPPDATRAPDDNYVPTPEVLAAVDKLIKTLNAQNTVAGREESKSYRVLFDAYLDLTEPPYPVGATFNQDTIHAGMPNWSVVSGWAESNSHMAKAVIDARNRLIVGLPYGKNNVSATYQNKGIYIDLVPDGRLGYIDFKYFPALETISAFVTAEVYRRMEAGQVQDALDLALAHIFVLRQFCDRDFLAEKTRSINMLSDALRNLRDVFYTYIDKISLDQFRDIALREIPFLRPDRNRLLMPEADRIVSETRLRFVFDQRTGRAIPDTFAQIFAKIQSAAKPLTLFGAARRWKMIATIHGSLDASLERLKLIYDDWWRRWRIDAYDPILEIETEFDRCNPVRYAAVLYSMADIQQLFGVRNQLIAEVNGTAMAAGVCGYYKSFGTYPRDTTMIYAVSVRKRSDSDPNDHNLDPFRYRLVDTRTPIDTPAGRIWLEPGMGLLYSVGQDHEDNLAAVHTDDGANGDVVIWPPIKALQRQQKLLD